VIGMPSARILVAEDEPSLAALVSDFLAGRGHRVVVATDGRAALELLRTRPFDVALLDLVMPEMDGLEVLRAVQADAAPPECIIITGAGTVDTAIAAMRLGAYDYIGKPYRMAEIDALVRRAVEKRQLATDNRRLASRLARVEGEMRMDSGYAPMHAVLAMARRVAPTGVPVLVRGERGTGKSSLARYLHRHSGHADGPLVEASCAAMHPGRGAIDLFGDGRDRDPSLATDAAVLGLMEVALGGSLVIDDVELLDQPAQAALADTLAHGAFRRMGAQQRIEAEVRIVATTTADLDAAVRGGTFLSDLRDRLSQAVIVLPPLGERSVDIPRLAQAFLRDLSGARAPAMSPEAIDALQRYAWPGNLRELRNVLERAVLLAGSGIIDAQDLPLAPDALRREPDGRPLSLADVERRHIAAVLQRANWHQGRAAAQLGISAKTLYRKIREFGFERPTAAAST
jgi:DNA-binding NtrC family response regulator